LEGRPRRRNRSEDRSRTGAKPPSGSIVSDERADSDAAPAIPERQASRPGDAPEPPAPARVMSIHAHPDDQEFTVGGTLAKWARAGSSIVTVCITSGGAGSNQYTPLTMTRQTLVP